jgi:hypothetical protein
MGFELVTDCGSLYDPFYGLLLVLPCAVGLAFVRYAAHGRRLIALDLSA